jgi:hypothetical protein
MFSSDSSNGEIASNASINILIHSFLHLRTAPRQVNCIAGEILLLLEKDEKSNKCDGSSGEA